MGDTEKEKLILAEIELDHIIDRIELVEDTWLEDYVETHEPYPYGSIVKPKKQVEISSKLVHDATLDFLNKGGKIRRIEEVK